MAMVRFAVLRDILIKVNLCLLKRILRLLN